MARRLCLKILHGYFLDTTTVSGEEADLLACIFCFKILVW